MLVISGNGFTHYNTYITHNPGFFIIIYFFTVSYTLKGFGYMDL